MNFYIFLKSENMLTFIQELREYGNVSQAPEIDLERTVLKHGYDLFSQGIVEIDGVQHPYVCVARNINTNRQVIELAQKM